MTTTRPTPTFEGPWPPARTDRHDALEELTLAVRRLVEASVATGVGPEELRSVAGAVHDAAGRLECALDDDPWVARSFGAGITEPGRMMGINPAMGTCNPSAPELNVHINEDSSVSGTVRFRLSHVGPPYRVHGGIVAAAFDQVLGLATIAGGAPGFTGTMTVKYRRPTPLDRDVRFEARLVEAEGRRSKATAHFFDDEGNVTAEAEGLFIAGNRGAHDGPSSS